MAVLSRSEKVDLSLHPPGRSRRTRVLLIGGAALLLLSCVGLGVGAWWSTPQPTDMFGLVQGRLAAQGGHAVPLPGIAPVMRDAVVATEDERFYRHHGIDSLGLARAMIFDVSHGSLQQGASTITEQLAKILYLGGDDRSPWRKAQDAALAVKIERAYCKPQILDAYLNAAYFGEGSVGIAAATRRYFARTPSGLNLAQASLLAGLIQAPTAYDPVADPGAARARQEQVLVSMIRTDPLVLARLLALHHVASPLVLPAATSLDRSSRSRRRLSLWQAGYIGWQAVADEGRGSRERSAREGLRARDGGAIVRHGRSLGGGGIARPRSPTHPAGQARGGRSRIGARAGRRDDRRRGGRGDVRHRVRRRGTRGGTRVAPAGVGFYEVAGADPVFAPIAARMHRLHQVRFLTPFENLCWAVMSQRAPIAVARKAKEGGLRLKERRRHGCALF